MALFGLLHSHSRHRTRQLRWVVPLVVLLLVAVLTTLAVQYRVSDQAVGTEFFRAHKTISHTGELLRRGMVIGGVVLIVLVLVIAGWALRLTHRIVRPVHSLHRALDALAAGDLGVRVELHRNDEFREVGNAMSPPVPEEPTALAVALLPSVRSPAVLVSVMLPPSPTLVPVACMGLVAESVAPVIVISPALPAVPPSAEMSLPKRLTRQERKPCAGCGRRRMVSSTTAAAFGPIFSAQRISREGVHSA